MSKLEKYKQYESILKEVYYLSKKRKEMPRRNVFEQIEKKELYSDLVYDFLMKQDMETVKVIQAIMYLGRELESEFEEAKRKKEVNPDLLIDECLSKLTERKGWKTQSIEAHQISGKTSLDKYLSKAFEFFGMHV